MRQEDRQPAEDSLSPSLPLVTSETNPIWVDFLPQTVAPLPGRLGMTFAPGKCSIGRQAYWQRDLKQDLLRLRQHYAVDLLVTLLEAPELGQLKIPNLFNQIEMHGMRTRWLPIHDFGTPTSLQSLICLVEDILLELEQKQTVVVHCRAGLGRTGLVTASCLVALGYSPVAAFAQVREARPGSVETAEQEEYVEQFARAWQDRSPKKR